MFVIANTSNFYGGLVLHYELHYDGLLFRSSWLLRQK